MEENKSEQLMSQDHLKKVGLVIAELSLNSTNTHMTGRGGNEDIFFVLCDKESILGETTDVSISETQIVWNKDWLEKSAIADIRKGLDTKNLTRPDIKDLVSNGEKLCLFLKEKYGSSSINDLLTGNFSVLDKANQIDKFLFICAMCKTLAVKLDEVKPQGSISEEFLKQNQFIAEYTKNIVSVSDYVSIPMGTFAIRNHLTLAKLVEFNLDEYPEFAALTQKILKVFDSK